MSVNAPRDTLVDVRLPTTPEITDDPVVFHELEQLYAAVRSLQAGICGGYFLIQATTANAPPYHKGALYFDTTLNKLRVGGATAWETVTSI